MTRFRCGQIWLVNFDPSFGHEYRKVRPALIIQSDAYIAGSSLLTVIPLSTQIGKKSPLDLLIRKDPKNRLKSDSLLKTMQVSSFDKRRFIKRIGAATTDSLEKAEAAVRSLLFNAEAERHGLEANPRSGLERGRFFELADRLARSRDLEEQRLLKVELARMIFDE